MRQRMIKKQLMGLRDQPVVAFTSWPQAGPKWVQGIRLKGHVRMMLNHIILHEPSYLSASQQRCLNKYRPLPKYQ